MMKHSGILLAGKKFVVSAFITLSSFAYANVNAVVSILPQQTFVKAIGGDKVDITLMVQPGNSPHSYEPKPSQMKEISKADIYFTIGVEFEDVWISKFADQNKKMKIVSLAKGIEKMAIEENEHAKHDAHEHKHEDEHDHESADPHIWTSPANVKIIAKNIYEALVKLDESNKETYTQNYNKFLEHIEQTNTQIQDILAQVPNNKKFMVFHPAWGYFARDYGLTQIAIEAGGKNPKPKQVMYLIQEAKEEKVNAVFTAPEFSEKVATQIALEVGVPVIKVSPLNPKWSENLINLAKAIAHK